MLSPTAHPIPPLIRAAVKFWRSRLLYSASPMSPKSNTIWTSVKMPLGVEYGGTADPMADRITYQRIVGGTDITYTSNYDFAVTILESLYKICSYTVRPLQQQKSE